MSDISVFRGALWRSGPRRHSAGSRAESRLGRRWSSRSCRNCSTAWDSAWKKTAKKKMSHFFRKRYSFYGIMERFETLHGFHSFHPLSTCIYIYISTVFSIVFSRAKSTTPPTLHESSSRPQGSDRKGMKRSSGSNQTALNHAKHPIESRPSVVPYLGRHQQASPWITGNQRSLRFANMCCLVVTSLLSNLDWKDMEK